MMVHSPTPTATNYVQASSATFKDLVQRLTGGGAPSVSGSHPTKLQDRRKYSVRDVETVKLGRRRSTGKKTRSNAFTPSPVLVGPTTPLGSESERFGTESPLSEEERAIAGKGFYLHASPPEKAELPVLLTLFPLTSPSHEV